jgi:hypothetical protein
MLAHGGFNVSGVQKFQEFQGFQCFKVSEVSMFQGSLRGGTTKQQKFQRFTFGELASLGSGVSMIQGLKCLKLACLLLCGGNRQTGFQFSQSAIRNP